MLSFPALTINTQQTLKSIFTCIELNNLIIWIVMESRSMKNNVQVHTLSTESVLRRCWDLENPGIQPIYNHCIPIIADLSDALWENKTMSLLELNGMRAQEGSTIYDIQWLDSTLKCNLVFNFENSWLVIWLFSVI